MAEYWPSELVEDVARRRAVLYLGAGVSAAATTDDGRHPPGWSDFLQTARRRLSGRVPSSTVKELIEQGDFLTACELLKDKLDESWPEVLKDSFLTPRYRPSALHKHLHALDLSLVLTPNFDKIYDTFAGNETNGETVVKSYYDQDIPWVMRRKYRAILKVHGTIDQHTQMIFTRSDYAAQRAQHQGFFDLVSALFLTHTFLFVGTSLSDPDLRLFLETQNYVHPNSPPHYMLCPKDGVHPHVEPSIRKNMNLKLLRYDPRSNHAELPLLVADLVERVSAKRQTLALAENW
ncbi:SIR2 family protein [Cellulosimicrobium sp. 72-3]|uniref:SIR2 family protein n=1 Tax=Cellulosimicrobium sp. 72-3 TaxID=2731680 RepID=UPI00148ED5B0|nr:SIR2 family protein [Cellulosimicrobium sp. 72-3]